MCAVASAPGWNQRALHCFPPRLRLTGECPHKQNLTSNHAQPQTRPSAVIGERLKDLRSRESLFRAQYPEHDDHRDEPGDRQKESESFKLRELSRKVGVDECADGGQGYDEKVGTPRLGDVVAVELDDHAVDETACEEEAAGCAAAPR